MRNLPKGPELEVLLDFYGADERTEAFLDLVDAARKGHDWWLPFKGAAPEWFDLYLAMESSAVQIDSYDSMIVPGLFQTPAYAKAVIRAGRPELPDAEFARRLELRMARQDVLTRQPDPPIVWSVLDESVLHRPAGKTQVLVEQLEHLVKLLDLPLVTIQLLPLEVGVHAGIEGTFMILTFPPELEGDPGVAYTEPKTRGTYYEDRVHDQAAAELTTVGRWRRSSYSEGANNCVEVTTELPGWVGVRDSKLGLDSPLLAVTLSQWRATLTAAQAGELDA